MGTKVFVIVLNYLHHQDTVDCIKTIKRSDFPIGTEIIIVDNSPDNGIDQELRKKFPKVHLIKAKKNFGFAGGNNLGIKYALDHKASHILIINPDVRVGKAFFKPLLESLVGQAGLAAPAIRHYQNGKLFYGLEGLIDWRTAKAKHVNLPSHPTPEVRRSEFVSFACVLIKSEVIKKTGLLDDGFFMYLEDVDYCLRAGQNGFQSVVNPAAIVDHQTSSSFKKATDKLPISFKSQIRFISKWLAFPKNLFGYGYTLLFYPYLFLLWTYFDLRKSR